MVNRIWQQHFGEGLVRHPEQLRQDGRAADASRAARLAGHGIRQERLERQDNAPADHEFRDLPDGDRMTSRERGRSIGDNRYLWRMPRRRLEGEAIRDSIMSVCRQPRPYAWAARPCSRTSIPALFQSSSKRTWNGKPDSDPIDVAPQRLRVLQAIDSAAHAGRFR